MRQLEKQLKKIEQEAIVKMPAPDQRATEGPEREKVLKAKLKEFLSAEDSARYDELKSEQAKHQGELSKLPPRQAVLGLAKTDPKPPVTYVLRRGSPQNEGPKSNRRFLSCSVVANRNCPHRLRAQSLRGGAKCWLIG